MSSLETNRPLPSARSAAGDQAPAVSPNENRAVSRPTAEVGRTTAAAESNVRPTPAERSLATAAEPKTGAAPDSKGPRPIGAGSPLVIGSLGTFSGPAGQIFADSVVAIAAWVKWANSHGGMKGHPIQHVVADDGGDPARHKALVRELVERRKIQAFVYKNEVFAQLSGPDPYVVEHRIPVIGTVLGIDHDYQSPFYFPQGASGDTMVTAMLGAYAGIVRPTGSTPMATFACAETPACGQTARVWKKAASSFGFEMAYQATISITQPDFTAECLAARNAGVILIALAMDDKSVARVARSCARQSYRPVLGGGVQMAAPGLATDPSMAGFQFVVGTTTFPFTASDNPARAEFHDVLKAYLPGRPPSGGHALGWTAAKLFERAADAVTEPPAAAALAAELWTLKDDSLGGLTQPLSFFPDRGPRRQVCWATSVLKDGRWSTAGTSDLVCLDPRLPSDAQSRQGASP